MPVDFLAKEYYAVDCFSIEYNFFIAAIFSLEFEYFEVAEAFLNSRDSLSITVTFLEFLNRDICLF